VGKPQTEPATPSAAPDQAPAPSTAPAQAEPTQPKPSTATTQKEHTSTANRAEEKPPAFLAATDKSEQPQKPPLPSGEHSTKSED